MQIYFMHKHLKAKFVFMVIEKSVLVIEPVGELEP
jgi:hypothetical protein